MIQYVFNNQEYIEAVKLLRKNDIIVYCPDTVKPRWKTHYDYLNIKVIEYD